MVDFAVLKPDPLISVKRHPKMAYLVQVVLRTYIADDRTLEATLASFSFPRLVSTAPSRRGSMTSVALSSLGSVQLATEDMVRNSILQQYSPIEKSPYLRTQLVSPLRHSRASNASPHFKSPAHHYERSWDEKW